MMERERKRKRSYSSDRSRTRHKHKHKHKDHKRKENRSDQQQRQYRKQRENYKRNNDQIEAKEIEVSQRNQMKDEKVEIIKERPCWQPSGILVSFYNSREGVSLKFHEPPESRPPIDVWRVYIFKGEQVFQPILLSNSCYLLGKDPRVCDILCENQSISRQHAVIQFRLIVKQQQDGTFLEQIKPYIMDLDSTNGTFLNGQKIQSSRYIQLLQKDVLKFGFSEREYVMVREEGQLRRRNDQE